MDPSLVAPPLLVNDLSECHFYHSMELPGMGTVPGDWDLRGRESAYLGDVDLAGKSVLELGTASGGVCFHMERQGARVVAVELPIGDEWDVVPFASRDRSKLVEERNRSIRRVANSFWLAHRLLGSRAAVVHSSIYHLPESLGRFDICTVGALLLHVRDPFLALERVSRHAGDCIVVAEPVPPFLDEAFEWLGREPLARLLPDPLRGGPMDSWWSLPSAIVIRFLGILGFGDCRLTHHEQRYGAREVEFYTIVARRGTARPANTRFSHLLARAGRGVRRRMMGRV